MIGQRLFVGTLASLVVLVAGCAPRLNAAPRLVAAWPAAGAQLPVAPTTFELTFNRPLSAGGSWAVVTPSADAAATLPSETVVAIDDARRLRVRLLTAASGDYRLRWHAVASSTDGVEEGDQTFSLRDASLDPPRLELSRGSAETGEQVELVGRGFVQHGSVRLTIGDDDQPLATTETDRDGAFTATAKVPGTVSFGLQPVVALDSRGATASAALQVRWGGWPPLMSYTVGEPGPRAGEVTFSVSLRNRSDYVLEHVRVIVEDPDGTAFVAAEPAAERNAGSSEWQLPMVDRGVVGPLRVTFRADGPITAHAWMEFRHRRPRGCSDDCLPAFISDSTSESTPTPPA